MRRTLAIASVLVACAALAGCTSHDEPVRIDYYVHGELWVDPGGTLQIDAPVVSAATGGRVLGYDVEGTATGGALTEGNDRGMPYFRFQADRDLRPPYVITLSVRSAGGADTVILRIEPGWEFANASFTSTLDGNLPEIGESWSGHVCGNPFGPWQVERVVTETDVQNTESLEVTPRPLDDRAGQQFGGVLMIDRNPDERSGDAPFRLYLDDVAPAGFTPATHRLPVEVCPLTAEACA